MDTRIRIIMSRTHILFLFSWLLWLPLYSQTSKIIPAADRSEQYLPLIQNKKIALVANQTSYVGDIHLVDYLISNNIEISKIFCLEHGFRGGVAEGTDVKDSIDLTTGLPIISLYGNNKKPKKEQLKNIDVVVFDIQDVGVRFYTYISSLAYIMEACAENNVELIILDRPNPNAHYIDGPVLEKGYESFVGMFPIPVVYGMTIGEYALMVNGERWLNYYFNDSQKLKIIKILNYTHDSIYYLPHPPSPNLQNMSAIWLYPSICFFEGTCMSVGRGTSHPFELVGHPKISKGDTVFIPHTIKNMAPNPLLKDMECVGYSMINKGYEWRNNKKELDFCLLIECYKQLKDNFFISFFDKLAGNSSFRKQIENNEDISTIRAGWQQDIDNFKIIRQKYLLY